MAAKINISWNAEGNQAKINISPYIKQRGKSNGEGNQANGSYITLASGIDENESIMRTTHYEKKVNWHEQRSGALIWREQ